MSRINKKTLIELINQYQIYLTILNYSRNTINSYAYFLDRLIQHMQDNNLRIFKKEVLNTFVLEQFSSSASYSNLARSALNGFFLFVCKNESLFCKTNIEHKKTSTKLPAIINQEKMLELIEAKRNERSSWIDYRNFAIVYLIYSSGARITEVLHIKPGHFFGNNQLLIVEPKGGSERIVYVNRKTLEYLMEYKLMCPFKQGKHFWKNFHGKQLTRNAASIELYRYVGIRPHQIRHFYATHLYKNGMDLLVLSELLGHRSISTTQIYIHLQKEDLYKCVERCHPLSKNLQTLQK